MASVSTAGTGRCNGALMIVVLQRRPPARGRRRLAAANRDGAVRDQPEARRRPAAVDFVGEHRVPGAGPVSMSAVEQSQSGLD